MRQSLMVVVAMMVVGCGEGSKQESCDVAPTVRSGSFSAKSALDRHNAIRREVFGDAPLVWSDSLAHSAQAYAEHLASTGQFQHASTKYGENLFASTHRVGYLEAIYSWYHEKSQYDHATNHCQGVCGHYTQMIWKESRALGCGRATYRAGGFTGGTIIVCRYDPVGNYVGERPY